MVQEFKGERVAKNKIKPVQRSTLSIIGLYVFQELPRVIKLINTGLEIMLATLLRFCMHRKTHCSYENISGRRVRGD